MNYIVICQSKPRLICCLFRTWRASGDEICMLSERFRRSSRRRGFHGLRDSRTHHKCSRRCSRVDPSLYAAACICIPRTRRELSVTVGAFSTYWVTDFLQTFNARWPRWTDIKGLASVMVDCAYSVWSILIRGRPPGLRTNSCWITMDLKAKTQISVGHLLLEGAPQKFVDWRLNYIARPGVSGDLGELAFARPSFWRASYSLSSVRLSLNLVCVSL